MSDSKTLNTEFITDIEVYAMHVWTTVQSSLKEVKSCIVELSYTLTLPDDLYRKWDLTPALEFVMKSIGGDGRMVYYYRGREVRPDCYFLRPKGYQEVTTLQVLQECVKQDIHAPNIKSLELSVTEGV